MFYFNSFSKKKATFEKSDFFYDGKNVKKLRYIMKEFASKKIDKIFSFFDVID